MNITNKQNLPFPFEAFAKSQGQDHAPIEGRYSVTELLKPTREIILERRHYNEISEDVADSIPSLFGTAVHLILEQNSEDTATSSTEFSIVTKFGNYILSGRIDRVEWDTQILCDYKTCTTSKVSKGDFEDWKLQGLMYAYMLWRESEFRVKKLRFYALMKDWSKIKSASSPSYPSSAVFVWEYSVEDSDLDFIEKWIYERFEDIKSSDTLSDDNLPECSEEERWYTGDKWAVYKNGGARATILCDSEAEANDYLANKLKGEGRIELRMGESIKCSLYCDACPFCKRKGGK